MAWLWTSRSLAPRSLRTLPLRLAKMKLAWYAPWCSVWQCLMVLAAHADCDHALQIFVCMANVDGAKAAKDAVHGRMFAGATVEVAFVSGEKYARAAAAVG